MLTAALFVLAPLVAVPQEQDSGYLPGYMDFLDGVELVSPWANGLSLELALERRMERLQVGQWTTVGGKSSTIAVDAVRSTENGRWLLDMTLSSSRSLLAAPGDDGSLAHRFAALADGVEFHLLCDEYGVPDTLVEVEGTVDALNRRRGELVAGLPADLGPVAAELAPTHDVLAAELIDLCEAWCIPIGYFLVADEPLDLEYYESPAWSVVSSTRTLTYRLEDHDELTGRCRVSCDDRPSAQDSLLTERLEDAGLAGQTPLGPIIRTEWDFDLDTSLPTRVKRVSLESTGAISTRETLTLSVR
ncbi:hypothetical protein [Engelhardtia mirabilis]|uniref:Uncharacterized protein n=1 Tax=Engelhardtia mirabilis TaxID=2528011 RepID=A0A518BHY3_9BACT|nr:hypothetical protein Pla133_16580 [Planctomycetes bacterium Pla133]QDV00908.1 hypothetical protein Pla86_16570 [Planctomycetes bacterium Pla86]